MKYTVLIVDDEEPARELLLTYVQKVEELELVASLNNPLEARGVINSQEVDILLSDIQMDDLTGIDLVKTLRHAPITIFTTAYSEFALESFDLDVVDYLVKPISFQRFCKAIDKAIELIQFRKLTNESGLKEAAHNSPAPTTTEYFFVKTNRKMVKVNYADILFIESYGEYVKLYTGDDVILALQTTAFMENLLPPQDFIRIHRSHIVNINQIKEIIANEIALEGHRLTISKRQKENFMKMVQAKGII